jgi:hypothetical protein
MGALRASGRMIKPSVFSAVLFMLGMPQSAPISTTQAAKARVYLRHDRGPFAALDTHWLDDLRATWLSLGCFHAGDSLWIAELSRQCFRKMPILM